MSLHPSQAARADVSVREREMSYFSEFLFVDPSVDDIETILCGLRPGVTARVLEAGKPASQQIALALGSVRDLDAVHVIAHGAPGRVNFSASEWSLATLKDQAENLAAVGRALAAGGELCLWSCDSAAGAEGAAFIKELAHLTGADVAAATGRLGGAKSGGNWELGVFAHLVPARAPLTAEAIETYVGVMAAATWKTPGTSGNWNVGGNWTGGSGTGGAPGPGDAVTLPNLGPNTYTVTVNTVTNTIASLQIGNGSTSGVVTVSILTGESLNVSGAITADGSATQIIQMAGTAALNAA